MWKIKGMNKIRISIAIMDGNVREMFLIVWMKEYISPLKKTISSKLP